MEDVIAKRKEKLLGYARNKKAVVYFVLAIILWIGYYIRTRNLPLLQDRYPLALDPYVFTRYAHYVLEHGKLMAVDYMRNYPVGFAMFRETPILPYVLVYFYKFVHLFDPNITLTKAVIIYPPTITILTMFFFFLFIRNIFGNKTALLATFLLTIIPTFLHRTLAGFADKEALGFMFMFASLYLFVKAWNAKRLHTNIVLGSIAGAATGFMGLAWGGVGFNFMIIGIFGFFVFLFYKATKNNTIAYASFVIVMIYVLLLSKRYTVYSITTSFTSGLIAFSLIMACIDMLVFKLDVLKLKDRILKIIPRGFALLLLGIIAIFVITAVMYGPGFFLDKPSSLVYDLLHPLKDRWATTVAESHEPFMVSWINDISWKYFLMVMIGSILLFYNTVKVIEKHRFKLTVLYSLFILSFAFSRYSPNGILNGNSPLSRFFYLGSPLIFVFGVASLYLYLFYKDKETFEKFTKLKIENLLVLVWFFVTLMGARRAVRLTMVFAPVTTVVVSYLVFFMLEKRLVFRNNYLKAATVGFVAVLLLNPFSISPLMFGILDKGIIPKFSSDIMTMASYTGPSFNVQWQKAMNWVKENTPDDAVFAHWWDYGYWVQTGGNRATITDGGNAIGYWNHLMGRHVLTGKSDMEALEFLFAHDAGYLLMISDEVGKYPAFSLIGSDENFDRQSWISLFTMDRDTVQETRDAIVYLYRGNFMLDDDFVYNDVLFPRKGSAIGGFFIPMKQENGTNMGFDQPYAVVFNNAQQMQVPLECVFMNGQEINFDVDGLDGCLMFIPRIEGNKITTIGSALYLSKKVKEGRFAQLYLFGRPSEYFELVYNDEGELRLADYNGRVVGPLKIWKINYPDGMEVKQVYLQPDFPDIRVTQL